jgi:hypothetical protein
MKKWLALPVLAALLLLGWLIAGPYIAIDNIREAVRTQDSAALAEQIDFPALRANLKAQVEDRIARRASPELQSSPMGAWAVHLVAGLAGSAVDAMITPAGIGAMMEGRNALDRLQGERPVGPDGERPPVEPLQGAEYGFESPSRFTATVTNGDGEPVVFVLKREGLDWKLSDIRLPPPEG